MKGQTVYERFWQLVQIGTPDECWLWTGYVHRGYGKFHYSPTKPTMRAHRVSALLHGLIHDIDSDELICHKCDNPVCVNPHHLYAGTAAQNNRDMHDRDRRPSSNKSKHSEEVKDKVIDLYKNGMNASSIARELNVQKAFVFSLLKRQGLR